MLTHSNSFNLVFYLQLTIKFKKHIETRRNCSFFNVICLFKGMPFFTISIFIMCDHL